MTTLLDNNSAKAFKEMLPLTMNMIELNGNEKYDELPDSLPTNLSNPQTIKKNSDLCYMVQKCWDCLQNLFDFLQLYRIRFGR